MEEERTFTDNENDALVDVCYMLVEAVEARIRRGHTKGEAMMVVALQLAAETGVSTGKAFSFLYKINPD